MTNSRTTSLKFFLLWLTLVSIGYFIGSNLGDFLTRDFEDRDFALGSFLVLALIGLFVGLGQWIVLNFKIKSIWQWIPATAIGFSCGGFLAYFFISLLGRRLLHLDIYLDMYHGAYQWIEMTATLFVTGMFIGALQWIALKKTLITSLKWLLISGLSLAIGYDVAYYIAQTHSEYFSFSSIQFGAIFVLIFGFITGAFAEGLIIRPRFSSL